MIPTAIKIREAGLRRARAEAFDKVIDALKSDETSRISGEALVLIDEIVKASFITGVEAQSDALQPQMAENDLSASEALYEALTALGEIKVKGGASA